MAIESMADADPFGPAYADEYNIHAANIIDLDGRVTTTTGIITAPLSGNAGLDTRVGVLENGGLGGLRQAIYPTPGSSLASSIGATEVEVTRLRVSSLSLLNTYVYRFNVRFTFSGNVAGDVFAVRLRLGSLAGTIVDQKSVTIARPSVNHTYQLSFRYISTSTTTNSFYLGVIRTSGTGTGIVANGSTSRSLLEAFQVGPPGSIVQTP